MHLHNEPLTDTRKSVFFRNQYRRLINGILILQFSAISLLIILAVQRMSSAPARYYASTTTGAVIPLQSLSMPVITQRYLLEWSKTVARSVYSLSFNNISSQLAESSQYFTQEGWQSFQAALNESGLVNAIQAKKLILSAVVDGTPVIINQYVQSGRYTWVVQLPLLVTFGSASDIQKRRLFINMTIKRVPDLIAAKGIAVTSFQVGGGINVFNRP